MRIYTILLSALLAVSAFAADVTGKWKATTEGPNGAMTIEFNFKVDGQKLSGSAIGEMGEMKISDGKIEGDNISFTVDAGDFKVVHKGTVSGDEMKLKVEFGEQTMEMTAKRVK